MITSLQLSPGPAQRRQPIEHVARQRDQVAALSGEGREAKCRWRI
jgi:hypothetical protein